jgi:hypothetical protein
MYFGKTQYEKSLTRRWGLFSCFFILSYKCKYK